MVSKSTNTHITPLQLIIFISNYCVLLLIFSPTAASVAIFIYLFMQQILRFVNNYFNMAQTYKHYSVFAHLCIDGSCCCYLVRATERQRNTDSSASTSTCSTCRHFIFKWYCFVEHSAFILIVLNTICFL